jgi:muramidase (phage lysozyme)
MSQPQTQKQKLILSLKSFLNFKEIQAFLETIKMSEGATYDTLYGGGKFSGNQHPNKVITKWGISSTAAGAFQFLYTTWLQCQKALDLKDFSPESQRLAAVYLINKRGAIQDIIKGDIKKACEKLSFEWASLPPARYGQNVKPLETIIKYFNQQKNKSSNMTEICLLITIAAIPFLIFSK